MMETTKPPGDPWIGRIIDQRYRVLEWVGCGGMGSVYRVEHVRMGKIAALKLLHPTLSTDNLFARRFEHEAEAISKLNHPNIVQVFDFGQTEETLYLVMEYLHGQSLGELLVASGPLPFLRCVPLLVQVCDALTEAHSIGVIHRDLKPENIQIQRTQSGRDLAKVVDFGLAKMVGSGSGRSPTDAGKRSLVGTPYYMAPEQIRGKELDHRCDIYGLGAVAYRVLTGTPAFVADTPLGVLTKHVTEPPLPPSQKAPGRNIPADFDAIVLKAMEKRADDRYASTADLKKDLIRAANRAASGRSNVGPLAPTASNDAQSVTFEEADACDDTEIRFEARLKRNQQIKAVVLVALVLIAGVTLYWTMFRSGQRDAPANEVEPNNTMATATPIQSKRKMLGLLGKRVSEQESDQDWYRLKIVGNETQQLGVSVTGIPNIDTTVALYNARGKLLFVANSVKVGGGEQITNWPIARGHYYLLVREAHQQQRVPTENVTDHYMVTIRLTASKTTDEFEPNDTAKQANSLHVGEQITAYLGSANDVDTYRVSGAADAPISCILSAIAGVDIVIEAKVAGAMDVLTVDHGGVGEGERVTFKSNQLPALLSVHRKEQRRYEQILPGIDKPYTLEIR